MVKNAPGAEGFDPDRVMTFDVEGDPVPWQRHKGHGKQSWTDPKVKAFKALVATYAKQAMKGRPPIEGPVELMVVFYLSPPKRFNSVAEADLLAGKARPDVKPDLDNLVKGIKDAMNEVVYWDDAQIVRLVTSKWYSRSPRTLVSVVRR